MRKITIEKCENGFIVEVINRSAPAPSPLTPPPPASTSDYKIRNTYVFESIETLNDWIAGDFAQDVIE